MASITRLTNEDGVRWLLRYRDNTGKSVDRRFRTRKEADQARRDVEGSLDAGRYINPKRGRITFGDWWAEWQGTRVDLRPSTRARDASYYRTHLEPKWAALQLAKITRTDVRGWVAELSTSGLAPATVGKAVQLLSKALTAAVDEQRIATNPATKVPLPTVEGDPMMFCSPDQLVDLTAAMDERFRVWVQVMAASGLRLGESVALRRDAVDLVRRRIEVRATAGEVRGELVEGPPKSRAGRRSVPIPGSVAELLLEHCATLEPDDLVFPAPGGGMIRAGAFRRRFWIPAAVAAGLGALTKDPDTGRSHYSGLRIHDLRHTAVSLWIAGGANPKAVATWAGHSSVSTVLDRYGHLLPGSEDPVMDALDELFAGATGTASAQVIELHR